MIQLVISHTSWCHQPSENKHGLTFPKNFFFCLLSDERDAIQKKTFTKWINNHLRKAGGKITDLFQDLRDGQSLLTLLELLSNERLVSIINYWSQSLEMLTFNFHPQPREKGKLRFHKLQNVETALSFLKRKNVKLVNIRPDDITEGNPKLTLGLIWTIILHFQVSIHLEPKTIISHVTLTVKIVPSHHLRHSRESWKLYEMKKKNLFSFREPRLLNSNLFVAIQSRAWKLTQRKVIIMHNS